jgi:hypothetical protein
MRERLSDPKERASIRRARREQREERIDHAVAASEQRPELALRQVHQKRAPEAALLVQPVENRCSAHLDGAIIRRRRTNMVHAAELSIARH